jgi:hypothetical protein
VSRIEVPPPPPVPESSPPVKEISYRESRSPR